jgi:hypothetical protein
MACISAASLRATDAGEAQPLDCWWRTSVSAVRIGEVFSAVLTCAAAETSALTVVVDQSRLDPVAAQWPPFEVLGGTHAPDLVTADRRFFQYEYSLRLISDSLFNRDVSFASPPISYRIRNTVAGQEAAVEGAAQTYELPPMAVRVLSLVPDSARDIRDAASGTFAGLDEARFRADMLVRTGIILSALAAGVALVGLSRIVVERRGTAPWSTAVVADAAVLRGISRELASIRRERQASGWTPPLIGRALAALRVLGAYALGRPVSQRPVGPDSPRQDGAVLLRPIGLRLSRIVVSASVTAHAVARALAHTPPGQEDRARRVEALQNGLDAFTRARYGRGDVAPDSALDEGLASGQRIVGHLAFARGRLGRFLRGLAGHAQRLRRRMGSPWPT